MGIISWFINQLITGGPHPVSHLASTIDLSLSLFGSNLAWGMGGPTVQEVTCSLQKTHIWYS